MTAESPTINLDAPVKARRIGELLINKGVVSEDQVRIALTEQRRRQERPQQRRQEQPRQQSRQARPRQRHQQRATPTWRIQAAPAP